MYGLFKLTFDYYCWEDLIVVSAVKENLVSHYDKINDGYPLISKQESLEIKESRSEVFHYVILDVLEI